MNQRGGLLGRRIVALHADGASNHRKFKEEAEKLIQEEHVSALFGPRASVHRKAIKEVVEKYNHLLFYPMQFEGLEESPNIVYLGAAPNQQIFPALDYMLNKKGKHRLFLVGSDYVYPRAANRIRTSSSSMRNTFLTEARRSGKSFEQFSKGSRTWS